MVSQLGMRLFHLFYFGQTVYAETYEMIRTDIIDLIINVSIRIIKYLYVGLKIFWKVIAALPVRDLVTSGIYHRMSPET